MIKKSIICFLVLAFLNFVIMSDVALADGVMMSSGAKTSIAIGAAVIVGLVIVGAVLLDKHVSKEKEQPQDQMQGPTNPTSFKNYEEHISTPSGQIALLRW